MEKIMKPFHIKFDGTRATIAVNIHAHGQWYKKTLKAEDGDSLWQGLQDLLAIDDLPEDKKAEAGQYLSKQIEREFIEVALPSWLAKGGQVRVVPPKRGKLSLDQSVIEEVLGDLFPMEEQHA